MTNGKLQVSNPNAAKAAAIEALRKKASTPKPEDGILVKTVSPDKATDRLRLLADDSGSMSSHERELREAVIEFFRNCIPGQSAAAVHLLCIADELNKMSAMNGNLLELASLMKTARFGWGGTPFFSKLKQMLEESPTASRIIAFTDGSPTDRLFKDLVSLSWEEERAAKALLLFPLQRDADIIIQQALEKKIPIDTIFFGRGISRNWETGEEQESDEVKLLKYLAEKTGGFFLLATDSQKLKSSMKYLAPTNRLMLTSEAVRKEIEDGRRV